MMNGGLIGGETWEAEISWMHGRVTLHNDFHQGGAAGAMERESTSVFTPNLRFFAPCVASRVPAPKGIRPVKRRNRILRGGRAGRRYLRHLPGAKGGAAEAVEPSQRS